MPGRDEPVAWLTPFFENNRNGKLVPVIVPVESCATPSDDWKPLFTAADPSPSPAEPGGIVPAERPDGS